MSASPPVEFSDHLRPSAIRSVWPYLPSAAAIAIALVLLLQSDSVRGIEAVYGLSIAGILLAVGLWDLAVRVREALVVRTARGGSLEQVPATGAAQHAPLRVLLVAAVLVVCAVLLPLIGYFAMVPILLVPTMLIAGIRSTRRIALVTGGVWLSVYIIFGLVLGVPLPSGEW